MMNRLPVRRAALALGLAAGACFADDQTGHAAAGGHEPVGAIATVNQGLMTAVTALVVFAIVFAVLATKVWPTITKALDERASKIKDEIEAAEMARQQAKDALEQYQKSLAEARAEAQKMLEQARSQQQALAADLKAKSDKELAELRDRARKDIENAKRAAVSEIYNEAANLSTAIAGKVLRRQVTSDDTRAMVDESVRQLAGTKN